jgi:hypothetical protein
MDFMSRMAATGYVFKLAPRHAGWATSMAFARSTAGIPAKAGVSASKLSSTLKAASGCRNNHCDIFSSAGIPIRHGERK